MEKLEILNKSLEVLQKGGVLLYPTDTIWGLGCDATQSEAVERIFRMKKRTDRKSMLILVDQPEMILKYVKKVPSVAWELLEASTSPLTLIFPGAKNLAETLTGDDGSIAIRVSSNAFCNALINRFKKPIVSTSANFSGDPWPVTYHNIHPELLKGVDFAVPPQIYPDGSGNPSSIIKLEINNEITILRK